MKRENFPETKEEICIYTLDLVRALRGRGLHCEAEVVLRLGQEVADLKFKISVLEDML